MESAYIKKTYIAWYKILGALYVNHIYLSYSTEAFTSENHLHRRWLTLKNWLNIGGDLGILRWVNEQKTP